MTVDLARLEKLLETALRRAGGAPAVARSEGGATRLVKLCAAEAFAAFEPERKELRALREAVKPFSDFADVMDCREMSDRNQDGGEVTVRIELDIADGDFLLWRGGLAPDYTTVVSAVAEPDRIAVERRFRLLAEHFRLARQASELSNAGGEQ